MALTTYDHHPSYFWSCITLQEDCPFFSMTDPTLYYFGIGLMVFYVGFVLIILVDCKFYWGVDGIQQKLDHYVALVKNKVQLVQKDQRRLMSMQERTEKQLKRSLECTRVLSELRGALAREDTRVFSELSALAEHAGSPQSTSPRVSNWPSNKKIHKTVRTEMDAKQKKLLRLAARLVVALKLS